MLFPLQEKLVSLYPGQLRRANFVLSWVDEDGDNVTVGTDEELVLALTEMAGPTYKITCTIKVKLFYNLVEKSIQDSGIGYGNITIPQKIISLRIYLPYRRTPA